MGKGGGIGTSTRERSPRGFPKKGGVCGDEAPPGRTTAWSGKGAAWNRRGREAPSPGAPTTGQQDAPRPKPEGAAWKDGSAQKHSPSRDSSSLTPRAAGER